MRFAFTEDQLGFRDAVRGLLAKECPPEVVRAAWPAGTDEQGARPGDGARAEPEQLDRAWAALADMGVVGIAVPEAQGGLGLSEVDWVLLAEEAGYAALPHPFVETACVAAPLLAVAGDPRRELPALVDGSRRAGVVPLLGALPARTTDLRAASATPLPPSPEGALDAWVPWVEQVDSLLVLDLRPAEPAWTARYVDGATSATGERGLDPGGRRGVAGGGHSIDRSRGLAPLRGARWGDVLATGDGAALAFGRGALGTAAQLVGLGRRMLDLTVGYVTERKQFGVPVGSQQAVKHHLADAALQLTFAAPAVYRAAWSLATGADDASRDVSMAKALASDAARLAGRQALQCHGAIGYTVEYDLHLYLKRAEVLARAWGSAAWHRNRVAVALGL